MKLKGLMSLESMEKMKELRIGKMMDGSIVEQDTGEVEIMIVGLHEGEIDRMSVDNAD